MEILFLLANEYSYSNIHPITFILITRIISSHFPVFRQLIHFYEPLSDPTRGHDSTYDGACAALGRGRSTGVWRKSEVINRGRQHRK